MIGFFNYTEWLTYLSLISAGAGIMISLSGKGHPYLGVFFLLISGLCDAFDGKVARLKKDRSDVEKKFGIQIDSLSDIVAFGVLPACIGAALLRVTPFVHHTHYNKIVRTILYTILILYMLSALIRLAYFNVMEEERQKTDPGVRKTYTGLPVTTSSLIFPLVLLLVFLSHYDLTLLYFGVMMLMGYLFLSKIQVKKPGLKGILVLVGIGAIEFVLLLFFLIFKFRR